MSYDPDTPVITEICNSLIGSKIQLSFTITLLNGENHTGIIDNGNIVGDIIQDILFPYIRNHIQTFEKGPKQLSPDFYNRSKMWEWELKCFSGSPAFDISNFISYISQLQQNLLRKMYKTRYMIFKYNLKSNFIELIDFKLCNVWEILNYNGKNAISMQVKKNIWYNIRPCSFNDMNNKVKTPELFLKQICKALNETPTKLENKQQIIEDICTQYYKIQYNKLVLDINKVVLDT